MPTRLKYQHSKAGQLIIDMLCLKHRLAFPKYVASELWSLIALSDNAEATAFRYETTTLFETVLRHPRSVAQPVLDRYYEKWLPPDLVHEALSELENRELVAPSVAARLHERVRQWTTDKGAWRF
jgi:hypothetical protein